MWSAPLGGATLVVPETARRAVASFAEWRDDRARLSYRDGTRGDVSSSEWQASDDTASDGYGALAGMLAALLGLELPPVVDAEAEAEAVTVTTTCRHCSRSIGQEPGGAWVDPEATGDDSVWRETCDAHDTFVADHEPVEESAQQS